MKQYTIKCIPTIGAEITAHMGQYGGLTSQRYHINGLDYLIVQISDEYRTYLTLKHPGLEMTEGGVSSKRS